MSKRGTQIILMTDERKVILELGIGGKFAAKSTGWYGNYVAAHSQIDELIALADERGKHLEPQYGVGFLH
jgi:hypothetical protein